MGSCYPITQKQRHPFRVISLLSILQQGHKFFSLKNAKYTVIIYSHSNAEKKPQTLDQAYQLYWQIFTRNPACDTSPSQSCSDAHKKTAVTPLFPNILYHATIPAIISLILHYVPNQYWDNFQMGVSGGVGLNKAIWNQAVLILGPVKSYFICKLICTPDDDLSEVTDIFNT